jgi:hypothetical protein
MKRLVTIAIVLGLAATAWAAPQTVTYGWEDGGPYVLGLYGAGTPPIIVSQVTAPVHSGVFSCQLEDNDPTGTPQAYLAYVYGLTDGTVVTASFWRYDTTPGAAPSVRIWAHWNDSYPPDINGYDGSASGQDDYGPGTGWDQATYTWVVSGGHTGIVIEARTYSNPGDTVWIDDLSVTAPAWSYIQLPGEGPIGTEANTWGQIKTIYR